MSPRIVLPVRRPARALQIAQPALGLGGGERACRKLAREHALAVEKEPHLDRVRTARQLGVDPGVILSHAPEASLNRFHRSGAGLQPRGPRPTRLLKKSPT